MGHNLSVEWARLFTSLVHKSGERGQVELTIDEFDEHGLPIEDAEVRSIIDKAIVKVSGSRSVSPYDTAGTIFPMTLWNPEIKDLGIHVYERYARILPRIQARSKLNRYGTYFQRMTAYAPKKEGDKPINQLHHVITTFRKGIHRRSGLQLAIFDPRFDHTGTQLLGFPCLQQIAFAHTKTGLIVTAFYPMQYVFARAYGNYLGLCWLGRFVAKQIDRRLEKVICYANIAKLGHSATKLRSTASALEQVIKGYDD